MRRTDRERGFTLVEVLIALAITAFVSVIAFTSFSTVITGVESTQATAERVYRINRAWMIISRDLEQFVARPVRDEFGELEPAMQGGMAARFPLSLSRGGWHNPLGQERPEVQRVNYRLEDNSLWRDSYPVLDRAGDTEAQSALLLEDVDEIRLLFLDGVDGARSVGTGTELDTRGWTENWVSDTSRPGAGLGPPLAIEVRLQLSDWGEMRRIYALPPL
ncbi:type II secretion system minor pseudopilin GspJ [Pseudohalioglobus lutimaris]|uniref:Type II secretion system protein J n=1 Tax=Pseudohalioglobus lutimaris TaxID=1737061 RepID=A0A2N5X762_9GAMM|nr:type II secretion system minor pseudopilin GspJ [Pseudohalioglobus lutimaris]PLW70333.1 type II secretion system protein GspJ [Pseudohalioglobus lutimaris]